MTLHKAESRAESAAVAAWDGYRKLPRWAHLGIVFLTLAGAGAWFFGTHGSVPGMVPVFFLPVLLAAISFGIRGGAGFGALSAVVVGPVAYEVIHASHPGPAAGQVGEWVLYIVTMTAIGAVAGTAAAYARVKAEAFNRSLHTDPGTSLPNLAGLRQRVALDAQERVRSEPDGWMTKAAVRMPSYQNLVNVFGYRFADQVVRAVADRLRQHLSADCIVARTAPNTLAVVAAGRPSKHLPDYTRLLAPQQDGSFEVQGIPVYVVLAVGLAGMPLDGFDVERLFSDAETAASEAAARRVRLVEHEAGLRAQQEERVRLLGEIGAAVRGEQFMLHYQPRLNLHSGRVEAFEALVRWHHPQRSWVPPATFVPLLEETRLIETFTLWVVHTALRQLVAWREQGHEVSVSVNVSARNLVDSTVLDHLQPWLQELQVPASCLELEITESAFIDIAQGGRDVLRRFRELGVRVAVDDFGTGYASLEYLRVLPLDILKLDKSFIMEGLGTPADHLMVRRMVQMAKDRDLWVVAEGVETREALDAVRQIGCDEAQGYLIARPLPPDDAAAMLDGPLPLARDA